MPSTIHIQNVNTDYLSISDIQQLENNDIKQIVLFYEPIQILSIKILKDKEIQIIILFHCIRMSL